MNFKELVPKELLEILNKEQITEPTEIQEKAMPIVKEGHDLIAGSATGSGKTLAFGAGIVETVEKLGFIQSLILTPTRELAEQIAKSIKTFSYKKLKITPIYGGVAINPQIKQLETTDIVVGTPGRILDHLERRTIDLDKVKILVLDEADRMLDMGFFDDVYQIINMCPKEKQTLLFSATINYEISQLSKKFLKNPKRISIDNHIDPKILKQIYYNVDDKLKFSLLVHLLKNEKPGLVMVFCNSRRNTDFIANNLKKLQIRSEAIHGGLSQHKRNQVIERFHKEEVFVLVCTDVAARGLDIKGISHVYNYDIPNDSKQYIHRIGRTARAGEEGIAINILTQRDYENFDRVLEDNDIHIEREETPYVERVQISWREQSRGNFRGRRR